MEADIISENQHSTSDLTKDELVLLHILDNNNNNNHNDYILPETNTVQGIQKGTKASLGYLSKILKRFEDNGLVEKKKSKIAGHKYKQYTYTLTEKGQEFTEILKNNFTKFNNK